MCVHYCGSSFCIFINFQVKIYIWSKGTGQEESPEGCLIFFLLEFGIVFKIFLQSMLEWTFWSFEGIKSAGVISESIYKEQTRRVAIRSLSR